MALDNTPLPETENVFTGRRPLAHVTADVKKLDITLGFLHGKATRITVRDPGNGAPIVFADTTLTGIDPEIYIFDNHLLATLYIIEAQKHRVVSCKNIDLLFDMDEKDFYLTSEGYRKLDGLTKRPLFVSSLKNAVARCMGAKLPPSEERNTPAIRTDFWTENALFVTQHKPAAPEKTTKIIWPEAPEPLKGWGVFL